MEEGSKERRMDDDDDDEEEEEEDVDDHEGAENKLCILCLCVN